MTIRAPICALPQLPVSALPQPMARSPPPSTAERPTPVVPPFPQVTAPSSVGFSQRGGVFCPFLRIVSTRTPDSPGARRACWTGRARTGCGFLDPHHQSQVATPICRACARSLTRDLGWPCLARSTLGRHASAQWLGRGCCCPGLITDTHLSLRKSPLVSRSLPLPR